MSRKWFAIFMGLVMALSLPSWANHVDGEDCDNEDEDCEEEEDGDECCDEEGEEDCCEVGGENPFGLFSGNVSRKVTDLSLAVQIGEFPMRFRRTMTSRPEWTLRDREDYPFGQAGNWRHSYLWSVLDDGETEEGEQKIQIIAPSGRVAFYHKKSTNDLFMTYLPRTHDRILPDGTNYYLLKPNGTRYHITERIVDSNKLFRMEGFWDAYSNRYDYVYNENGDIIEARAPNTNHFFRFEYQQVTNSVDPGIIRFAYADAGAEEVLLAGSFNDWQGAENPMIHTNGEWVADVELEKGFYAYKFVVKYPADPTYYWIPDPENPLVGGVESNSVAVVDPFRLISRVEASDGRSVTYRYDWSYNPGHWLDVLLVGADYGDGQSSSYAYYPASYDQERKALPFTADDPHWRGAGRAVMYTYRTNTPWSGKVFEEFSLVTTQLFGRVINDPVNPDVRVYTDAAGNTRHVVYNHLTANPMIKTNAVGDVTRKVYFDGFEAGDNRGMLWKDIDAMGRTSVISRTWHFGAVISISNANGSCSCSADIINVYTDEDYPFYLASKTEKGGRTTSYTRDGFNRPTRIDFPDGTFETNSYNSFGQILATRKPDGALWTYTYDERGRRTSMTDPMGAVTTYAYDQHDRLAAVTDAVNRVTLYEYNWRGDRTRTIHPDDSEETWFYDRYGSVTQHINRAGGVTVTVYDELGRIASVTDPVDAETVYQYDAKGRLITMTYPSGLTVSNTYDGIGRKIRETFSTDSTFNEWHYDPDGVRTQINRLGQATLYDYNEDGDLWRVTDALGRQMSYAYDDAGNRSAMTNDNGSVTFYTYDLMNRLTSVADCDGVLVSNVYDGAGRVLTRADANGIINVYFYDAAGRLLSETRASQALYTNVLNEAGWLMARTDGAGITITNLYDDAGRPFRTFWPDQTFTETRYTNIFVFQQVDRAGRTTTFHRDVIGRVTNQVDNASESVSYVYDQSGRMVELIDQGGTSTIWDYDPEGRQTAKVYADGTTNSYGYNALGQLIAKTDAMGRLTQYRYDAVGNMTNIQFQTDAPVSFAYDNLNRVETMVDGVGTTEYTYATDCGSVATVTGPFGDVVSYAYDTGKRLTNVVFQGESRGYALDDLNRIISVDAFEVQHQYAYVGATRRVASLARGNGTISDYHYDALGRLTNLVNHAPGDVILSSFAYTLDNADQRTQVMRENGFHIDYDYDPIGQLIGADGKSATSDPEPGWQFGYQYDERGNPLRREHSGFVVSNSFNNLNQQADSQWSGGGVVLGLVNTTNATVEVNEIPAFTWQLENLSVFAATNLPLQEGENEYLAVLSDMFGRADTNTVTVSAQERTFGYDLNGNLTNDGVRVYIWDEADRLIEVRDLQTSDVLVQNRYDGLGRRRERIQRDTGFQPVITTNRYVYDGWLVVAVLDGENEVLEQYIHGVDLSGTREGAGGIGGILHVTPLPGGAGGGFFHYDGSGNVMTVTDQDRNIVSRYEYDPFGRVLLADGDYTPRYQFSSKEYDEATGLNYYGYRFYNPGLGRWINRDPIGEFGGINLYLLVQNNTLNWHDLLGLAVAGHDFRGAFGVRINIDVSFGCDDGPAILQSSVSAYQLTIGIGLSYDVSVRLVDVKEVIGDKCCLEDGGEGVEKGYTYTIDWVLYRTINLGIGWGGQGITGPVRRDRIASGSESGETDAECCEE